MNVVNSKALTILLEKIQQNNFSEIDVDSAIEITKLLYAELLVIQNSKTTFTLNNKDKISSQILETEVADSIIQEEIAEPIMQEIIADSAIEENLVELSIQEEPLIAFQEDVIIEEIITKTNANEDLTNIVIEEKIEESVVQSIIEPTTAPPIITTQDKIAPTKSVVNSDNDLSSKLSKKPISNIATAIGINDRYQFIQELFSKNSNLYSSTIQELNNLKDFAQALDMLQNRFDWDYENSIVQKFVAIVERRYL